MTSKSKRHRERLYPGQDEMLTVLVEVCRAYLKREYIDRGMLTAAGRARLDMHVKLLMGTVGAVSPVSADYYNECRSLGVAIPEEVE